MARRSEEDGGRLLGSAEIASYLVENDGGNEKVIARTSVNSPILAPDGKHVHRLGGVRVKMIEEEDKTVKLDNGGSQFYQKDVNVIQEPLSKKNESVPDREYDTPMVGNYPSPPKQPAYNYDSRNPAESPLGQMKNHLDQVHSWVKILAVGLLAVAVISSVALGGVIFG